MLRPTYTVRFGDCYISLSIFAVCARIISGSPLLAQAIEGFAGAQLNSHSANAGGGLQSAIYSGRLPE